jgi:hypothetical protein
MRIPTLSAIALTALLATGGVANAQAGGGSAPSVSPVTDFPLVKFEAIVSDAAGTTVKTLACEWREPEEDDMACIKFQGDPQTAFATIEEAGGVRADKSMTFEDGSSTTAYSKRADGTWLIRTKGTVAGKNLHNGYVCTADGQSCKRWDVDGAKFARKSVKAAAAKLRR